MTNSVLSYMNSCFNGRKGKAFLHCIVTGDEKWTKHNKPKHRRLWGKPDHASTLAAKLNIHGLKLLLCIWWDQLGVVYELLKPTETIMGDHCWLQLMIWVEHWRKKWLLYEQRHDKVILLHDNTRPHVVKWVKTYLEMLKWEVLPHSPYSPDIAPSNYHLFWSMAHGLTEQHFHSHEDKKKKKWVDSWLA